MCSLSYETTPNVSVKSSRLFFNNNGNLTRPGLIDIHCVLIVPSVIRGSGKTSFPDICKRIYRICMMKEITPEINKEDALSEQRNI